MTTLTTVCQGPTAVRLQHWTHLAASLILPCLFTMASGENSTQSQDSNQEIDEGSLNVPHTITLTLGITIPSAIIIGAAWCYCMSALCRIRDSQGSKGKGHLHLPPQTHYSQGSYANSDVESPPESTTAGSPPDSPILGISPQMPRSPPSGLGTPEGSRPPSPAPSIGSQRPSTSSGIGT